MANKEDSYEVVVNGLQPQWVRDKTLKSSKLKINDEEDQGLVGHGEGDEGEENERGNWGNDVEFILSCFSYAVGLGTIWRFPYLCYRNGGGAFLIPYAIMFVFTGLPLFFLEMSFGQYASQGPVSIWSICPLFQGLGYGMFVISFVIGIYYNMVVAWSLRYFWASLTSVLPWTTCDNAWNTEFCSVSKQVANCTLELLNSNSSVANCTEMNVNDTSQLKLPADEYFHNHILNISSGIEELGSVRWDLALCLLISWLLVFVVLLKGIQSFGKAVYFTALFPYVILTILLIRAATLPGFMDGIWFYVTPRWEELSKASVWGDAAMQIFFSLSPCWGGLITLASYNQFHNNCFRDSLIVATGNVLTSFYAGLVIFGIIGFLAHDLGVKVDSVSTQGAGLAFIAYPAAVARLPIAPLWSILFFVMFLTLGLGTQFTILETVVTTIVDLLPEHHRKRNHKYVLVGSTLVMCLLGLIMCTQGGMYVLQLIDQYAATFSALILGMIESVVIAWVYGVDRFLADIKLMIGYYPTPRLYWKFIWKYFTPVIILAILIFTCMSIKPLTYGDYVYPASSTVTGFFITSASVVMVPVIMCVKIYWAEGSTILQRIRLLLKPTSAWGPALEVHRREARIPAHTDSKVPLAGPATMDDLEMELDTVLERREYSDDEGLQMN